MKITKKLTIVIPHHNQHAMLAKILKDIETFQVLIVKGGSFAKNCNKGASMADTELIVFLNDDTRIKNAEKFFEEMAKMMKSHEIVGCLSEKGFTGEAIVKKKLVPVFDKTEKIDLPAGHCVMMAKKTWEKLKGYDEAFINGCEDIDLYFRAKKMKMKIGVFKKAIDHIGAQSENRFDHIDQNVILYNKRWGKVAKNNHLERVKKAGKIKPIIVEEWETI